MSNSTDFSEEPGCSSRALGIGLLSAGLIGMALGVALQLVLLLSPSPQNSNDLRPLAYYIWSLAFISIVSLPVLIGLVLLKVRWFLAIGAILLPLLAAYAYAQGWLPHDPTSAYKGLIYGGGVIVLSLILVVSVVVGKGKSAKMPEKHS